MRFLLGLLAGLVAFASALSSTGNKLLVVIEELADKEKYSHFWADLEARGFQLTYKSPKDTDLSLFQHGVPAYSHALILPPKSKGLGPQLTPNLLVDFVNAGSNILLALSSEQPTPSALTSLLLELDVSLSPDRGATVVDHFNYDTKSASEQHDVLLLKTPGALKKGTKDLFSVDGTIALPHVVGQVLGNASPLLAPILKAPATAYITNPKSEEPEDSDLFASGPQISLVSAFQGRNSARFTVLGSSAALEDTWFSASVQRPSGQAEKTANRAFATKLSAWTFQELGVLKVGTVEHRLNEPLGKSAGNNTEMALAGAYQDMYRVKNEVHYSIELSEYNMDHLEPYTPPAGDSVQMEFSMLSPFHRLEMQPSGQTANSTIYTAEFKVPDQHGIFNFIVNYKRPFLTNIYDKKTVTVRHFAHDEWPRSYVITGAYPWISGVWVTIVGWLIFVAVWLYSKPAQEQRNLKADQKR